MASWCGFFYNIRQNLVPFNKDLTDEIIDDDDRLDAWLKEYREREERKRLGQETLEDKLPDAEKITPETMKTMPTGAKKQFVSKSD